MFLFFTTLLWGCPESSICSSLAVTTSNKQQHHLDVQHWPAQKKPGQNIPIYFIAGGPGQSATALAPILTPSFSAILDDHDIWFLSPLGTQAQNPFNCKGSGTTLEQVFNSNYDIAHCLPSKDFTPQDYGSEAAAHHLEALRKHNNHERIILYGVSYGTRVAQIYAALYPQHTHTLVLDAVLPLDIGIIGSSEPAERILKKKIPAAQKSLSELLKQLPMSIPVFDAEKKSTANIEITPSILAFMVHALLYAPDQQDRLADHLKKAQGGNWNPLLDDFMRTVDLNVSMGVYFSAFCSEDLPFLKEKDPFFPFAAHLQKYCSQWPQYNYERIQTLPKDLPILILNGHWDPVSPPAYAQRVQKDGDKRYVLSWPNQAHVVSFRPCAQKAIAAFLKEIPLSFVLKDECAHVERY